MRLVAGALLSEKARLLDLSDDAIIMRDMEGRIRYWNHGAEEIYGWSRKEAMGKISHLLLQTEFPTPLKQITAELHRGIELGQIAGDLDRAFALSKRIRVNASMGYLVACRQAIRCLHSVGNIAS